jgi:hypothetical protein
MFFLNVINYFKNKPKKNNHYNTLSNYNLTNYNLTNKPDSCNIFNKKYFLFSEKYYNFNKKKLFIDIDSGEYKYINTDTDTNIQREKIIKFGVAACFAAMLLVKHFFTKQKSLSIC